MYSIRVLLIVIMLNLHSIKAGRVLGIFPTPSISHQVVFRHLTLELLKRGHEVVVLTPDPIFNNSEAPQNYTEIDVHDVSYKNWEVLLKSHKGKKEDIATNLALIFERSASTLDLQMQTPKMQEILKKGKKHFDLLLLESFNRPLVGILNVFDAPSIQVSSYGLVPVQYNVFGAPMHPLLYPTIINQKLYNLSNWEKLIELLKHMLLEYLSTKYKDYDYFVMRKHFGRDVPSFDDLTRNLDMIFVNEHPIWAENRPVPPNILYIGGIHRTPQKELSKDLKSYLDLSDKGVIYISFGTNVLTSVLSEEKVTIMTKVLSQLPYNVLWKWDEDELPGKPKNIKIQKWFPQADLLKHPNVKAFVTQGGLQSTDEAIDAGVPLIGVPMLGDQWYNVEKYVHHKIGVQLDFNNMNEKSFRNAIEVVINDPSYKQNIAKLRELMNERPMKPLDEAVWWIEHVMKYGGKHLRPPSANMGWKEYYEINLMLTVTGVLFVTLLLILSLLRLLVKFVFKKINIVIKYKIH